MIYDVLKLSIDQADPDFRRVYKHCCRELSLDDPPVYLFSQSDDSKQAEPANWIFRNGQLVAPREHKDYKGFCRQFNMDLFIRAGLSKQETLMTLAHELYHLWEYKIGKACVDELLAEDFAIENYNKLKKQSDMKTVDNPHELERRLRNNIASATKMQTRLQHELSNCANESQKNALLECWNMATNDHERQEVLDAWRGVRTTESTRMLDRLKNWLKSER